MTKMAKNDTLRFMTKTTEKLYLIGPHKPMFIVIVE